MKREMLSDYFSQQLLNKNYHLAILISIIHYKIEWKELFTSSFRRIFLTLDYTWLNWITISAKEPTCQV